MSRDQQARGALGTRADLEGHDAGRRVAAARVRPRAGEGHAARRRGARGREHERAHRRAMGRADPGELDPDGAPRDGRERRRTGLVITRSDTLAGVFVGGQSRRMGGKPKGLLERGGVALVDRWGRLFDALGVDHVLVGENRAYLPRRALPDAVQGVGPLGGLVALLAQAGERRTVAVACDMPYVTPKLVERLLGAEPANAVAARRGNG